MPENVEIRECLKLGEMRACVDLQREVFALPEVELSPVRHFVVTKNAGGFALGAFAEQRLVGFVLSVPAFLRGKPAFYSHMTAVSAAYQGSGVGARLKWAQRERSLAMDIALVKWTFEPVKARNAYFNLEKLGAVVTDYKRNFYGTDYPVGTAANGASIDSDRLFAEWRLDSDKVTALAGGGDLKSPGVAAVEIHVSGDWNSLVNADPSAAAAELKRVRAEFERAFADGLICRGFDRKRNSYLLFEK